MDLEPVPANVNFSEEEEKILEYWDKIDAFQTSFKRSEGRPNYSFYDGPPFATGLPHYGHILAGTIKDVVTRYYHQKGFRVERRFGWDCHGLPVEYEIDKLLGIKGKEDVERIGIAKYNEECRKIVMRYSKEWEQTVKRMGRWIDFENDYKTLNPSFMESVWWVFKSLHVKNLVYRGFKVMPFSTACNTPLSNFEANLNYKDASDPAIIISFPLKDDPTTELVAWTTTPWTLPANLALCVHPDLDYVKIDDLEEGRKFVMLKARLPTLYPPRKGKKKKTVEDRYKIIEEFKGTALEGQRYVPLFDYYTPEKLKDITGEGFFQVVTDTYVTDDSGTGVVHQAPGFGEDDYRICIQKGIVKKGEVICPVDDSGKFIDEVTDFKGMYVKDADPLIVEELKRRKRMLHVGKIVHSYPFCWRSDTPLIYKAIPSWFVNVETIKQQMLENNLKTRWVPAFVQEKRFANWLANAKDWAISRNRYWGTPLPIWTSEDYEEIVVVGSIKELEELTGKSNITDIHRENVDDLTIPSKMGKGELRRVPEVLDCWFESGSMPYASQHYPFEKEEEFKKIFPADFIGEGLDQTRGWFYTLLVLSTALFDEPPFKNLIVNGLVLAEDGKKMAKRLSNYDPPLEVVHKYSADAVRLYLVNSPVVRAEILRFQTEGVKGVVKDVFFPWYNAYRFLVQCILGVQKETGVPMEIPPLDQLSRSGNEIDKWIISALQSLTAFIHQEMEGYRLYTVIPRLVEFIDLLTNTYVRLNRKKMKGNETKEGQMISLATLFHVLLNISKLMCPFTPFLVEIMYQNLRKLLKEEDREDSIHYCMLPAAEGNLVDEKVEKKVIVLRSILNVGRMLRDRARLSLKTPVARILVVHRDAELVRSIESVSHYLNAELNTKEVELSSDEEHFVKHVVEPESKVLGPKVGRKFVAVKKALAELTMEQVNKFLAEGKITLEGIELEREDIRVRRLIADSLPSENFLGEASSSIDGLFILLDTTRTQELVDEGLAREFATRIQRMRKTAGLVPYEKIKVFYEVVEDMNETAAMLLKRRDLIVSIIHSEVCEAKTAEEGVITEESELAGSKLKITIARVQG